MGELGEQPAAPFGFDLSNGDDGSALVRVRGELDVNTAPRLDSAVAPIIAQGPNRLVVDASELEFADSSAIALLVRWANVIPRVELHQPRDLLRHVIARMGLSERLRMSP
jgi:anti-sigma B factor antagonist